MSALAFNLLGPFEATLDSDQELHFPTTKTQALLAYLLVENCRRPGISHQRGNLMGLLWPDILPESAQTNLRQTLYRLRKSLPKIEIEPGQAEPFLLSDRQSVQVNPVLSYYLDVTEFERSLREAEQPSQVNQIDALSEAVTLYRGDFLGDVIVPDSEAFENWSGQIRAELRRRVLEALTQIGDDALAHGDYPKAEQTARQQIAIDDLHEIAYLRLMIALSATGKRNKALTEFAQLSRLLARELEVEPARETAELAEAIRQGDDVATPRLESISRDTLETPSLDQTAEAMVPGHIKAEDSGAFKQFVTSNEFAEMVGAEQALKVRERFGGRTQEAGPADKNAAEPPSNLPFELNRFVGRQGQITGISNLFERDNTRLVTLTGPGGVGKTRLATKVAAEIRENYSDGVWLIELAPLSDPSLIPQLTVRTFALVEEKGQPLIQTLIEYLRTRELLLVLDNCEHLIEDAAQFTQSLLRAAPNLHILATSREPLGSEGEIIWTLPPLSSPDPETRITPETLAHYEATDLFIERAQSVQPHFRVNQENASALAHVCACLDGIPLAIELAAARLKALSVEDVAARLDDRFQLLVGRRTMAPRQQTLQALIDWSHDLLPENERLLMRRLSVFAGGWSLEAAEDVCSGEGIEKFEILELLAQLVDKSLVMTEGQKGGQRYKYLETIRQYAADRLEQSEDDFEIGARHSQYFLSLVEGAYRKCWGKEQGYWLDRLEIEHDNIRKALVWLSIDDPTGDSALRMAGSLWRFWEVRGYIDEGRSWMSLALKINPNASTYVRANGLRGAGILARQQGDYVEAKVHHEQSLKLFRELGVDYELGQARELDALGGIEQFYGNYEKAIPLHEESLALQQGIGDKEGIAASLAHLGVIAHERGQYDEAEKLLGQSLELNRELGDKLRIGVDLNNLGLVATLQCKYEEALAYHEEAVQQYRDLDNKLGISNSLMNLGTVAKDRGDFRLSDALYHECLALKKQLGDRRGMARTLVRLATSALLQGDYLRGRELAKQSLTAFRDLGIKRGIVSALRVGGLVAVYEGEFEAADRISHESLSLAKQLDAPYEAALAKVVLGLSAHARGELVKARRWFEEALALFREANNRRSIAHTLVGLARTAYRLDDLAHAQEYLEESLSLSREFTIQWSLAYSLEIMGLLRRSEGNYLRALQRFQESLHLSSEQGNRQGITNCLGAIAGLAAMLDQPEIAVRLFAASERLRSEIGGRMGQSDHEEYEACLQLAKDPLGEAAFKKAWREGQALSTEEAIQEALSSIGS